MLLLRFHDNDNISTVMINSGLAYMNARETLRSNDAGSISVHLSRIRIHGLSNTSPPSELQDVGEVLNIEKQQD